MVNQYTKGCQDKLSINFKAYEFDCPCTECKITFIDSDLVSQLQKTRDYFKSKLAITSGYRCTNYQNQLRLRGYETAKGLSQHQLGKAADIANGVASGAELEEAARASGFTSVGVGKYFIHVDTRPGQRRWFYNLKRSG